MTGGQTQSGSAVLVRKAGGPTFTALPMKFHSAVENNKCHKDLGGARMTPRRLRPTREDETEIAPTSALTPGMRVAR